MPTYAILDSQSVKTASSAHDKGFDGGKKIKGRKRHIAVDTLGNLFLLWFMQPIFMTQKQVFL
nr:transposase [Kingella negevensis]